MSHDTELVSVMASLVMDRDRGVYPRRRRCFLKDFSDRPCDGRLVKAHLISRQFLRRELMDRTMLSMAPRADCERAVDAKIADPRSWVWACGGPMGNAGHHGMLDASRTLRIPRDRLPAGLEEFAEELGLTWYLCREYGCQAGTCRCDVGACR
jgi:hypothetical protein